MKRRSDGRYVKTFVIDGKRKAFYSHEKTEKKAEKDIERQLIAYQTTKRNNYIFNNIADKWDSEYRLTIPDITYNKTTRAALKRILSYFEREYIEDITPRDIDVFIRSLTFGFKTVAWHKCILNMIFDYAVLHGFTDSNPVQYVKMPKNLTKGKRELPTTEELKIVSSHWEGFDLLPFFLLNTGCRKSEALAVRRENIDFNRKLLYIKNHVIHDGNRPVFENVLKSESAEREIIIPDKLLAVLPKRFKGFLFSMQGDGKEPLTKRAYDKRWKKYCDRYSLNITAHQLRHGYATMLFEAGIDIKDAQDLMGHSDINLTRSIYTHIRDKRKVETAEKINNFVF